MKKITAIFFLSFYLLSATESHQLLKLPVVFQHFAEHKMGNKNITFLQFLDMHYMHGSPKYDDYARDMQLPFKTSADCLIAYVSISVSETSYVIYPLALPIAENEFFIGNDSFIPSEFYSNIFQPPRA